MEIKDSDTPSRMESHYRKIQWETGGRRDRQA